MTAPSVVFSTTVFGLIPPATWLGSLEVVVVVLVALMVVAGAAGVV